MTIHAVLSPFICPCALKNNRFSSQSFPGLCFQRHCSPLVLMSTMKGNQWLSTVHVQQRFIAGRPLEAVDETAEREITSFR